jgi:serine/threonine-protein kinase
MSAGGGSTGEASTGEGARGLVLGGRYQLGTRIGTGVHSTVFEAVDLQLERAVAVKVLHPSAVTDPEIFQRFRAAAEKLSSLSHPNLVAVHDWGQEDIRGAMTPYLVMELLTGGSLRSVLDRGRLLSPSQALIVGLDACRGLDHAHRRGLVHGDIKPSNLLFGDDRRLRVADLGIARLIAEANGDDVSSMDLASARYVSPEQAQHRSIDGKADVYSLALTLVEAVTGQMPFGGDTTVAALTNRIDKLLPVSADLGPLAAVLERAGRPNPVDRFTAAEFGRALVQTAEKLPRPAPLPLVAGGTSMFEAPPGQETTSELTRFRDPTGSTVRPTDPSGGASRPNPRPTDPKDLSRATSGRDPSGPMTRPPRTADTTGGTPRTRVVALDDTGGIRVDSPTSMRPKRRLVLILLLVVGLVAASVLGYVAYQRLTVPSFAVPDLVGQDEGAAQNLIAENGWDVQVQRERNDDHPAGAVIRTEPTSGNELQEGKTFVLVVSDGPTLSPLPEITGLTQEAAAAALSEVGLFFQVGEQRRDENIPIGTVISWTVGEQPSLVAGAEVVKGTVISAVVSAGPPLRDILDYTGQVYADVKPQLEAAGLVVELAGEEFSSTYPIGAIIAQSVAPGDQVERGSTIRFALSKGPDLVTMPTVFGLDLATVATTLDAAGLVVGVTSGNVAAGRVATASVGAQPAVPGQALPRNTPIDLLFF